jgi:hypothetical protein
MKFDDFFELPPPPLLLGSYHVQAIVAMLEKIYRSDKLPLIQYHVLP